MRKVLILYRELAGYFVACLNDYCERYQTEADVIAYPINPDAPFKFEFSSKVRVRDRFSMQDQDIINMAASGQYDLVFCGGWADPVYLKAVKARKEAMALLAFDNQWQGNMKQRAASIYARFFLSPNFDFAFVPGIEQREFAERMGFKQISLGVYSCDYEVFNGIYHKREQVYSGAERRLVYVGRYAGEKYFQELCEVFCELYEEGFSQWELHAAGTGPLWDQRKQHQAIRHYGFLQPSELREFMHQGHAFVLPSIFEPWGVVVHEFAAAGYPMVISNRVGARTAFLEEGKNGFLFTSGSRMALKDALRKLLSCSENQLRNMSAHSHLLASSITPELWSKTIAERIKTKDRNHRESVF
jgi:glycosyltransferase involved in cell wall biosynthesis